MQGKSGLGSRALLFVAVILCAGFAAIAGRSDQSTAHVEHEKCAGIEPMALKAEPSDTSVDPIERVLLPQLLDSLTPDQQSVLIARLDDIFNAPHPTAPLAMLCFAPDTPEQVIQAFNIVDDFGGRYNQTTRWGTTASGSTGSQGDPITLTYGFPADGVTIPVISGVSYPAGPNSLNAWLNGIYGSQAVWKPLFDQTFARWSSLSGITYVYEPNDDGSTMNQNSGVLGVRADLRIGAKTLDGNSGVLAYNNFPPDGDMVFDAFDSFFSDTSNSSLKIRNVIAHEHGHGMGQLHVCPIQQTKLMEPFVSTAFNGPLHDDVRNAQRFYGDPFEPDNNPVQATDLGDFAIGSSITVGTAPAPAFANSSTLSIDANGEQDYFFFEVNMPSSVNVTITPIGTTYDDSDQACSGQSGSCCSGNNVNSLAIADLNVDVIGSNGVTILASGNASPAGSNEVLTGVPLQDAGGYFLRVYEGDSPSQSQLYKLTMTIAAPVFAPLTVQLPNGAPDILLAGQSANFDVEINPRDESLQSNSASLFYRYDGGSFVSVPLSPNGGNNFVATLPPPNCDASPEFYVSAIGTVTGQVTFPAGGASSPLTAFIPQPLSDNFEADEGWTVTNSPSGTGTFDGAWQRGVPVNLNRGDPPADFDGSGQCYLTDNDPLNSNSDVDNGSTTLTSRAFPMESGDSISYRYWLNDFTGGLLQGGDSLRVEVATDLNGTNWVSLRNYTTASNQWRVDTIVAGTEIAASNTMRIRFTANDIGTQNVIEAAIDAFVTNGPPCEDEIQPPPAPTGVAATDGGSCTHVTISWNASTGADDYEVWRNTVDDSGTAAQIDASIILLTYDDLTASSGVTYYYWIKACNSGGCSTFSSSDSGFANTLPDAVDNLTATVDTVCDAVDLNWTAATGADQYTVRRNTTNDFNSATVLGNVAILTFSDTTGDPSTIYTYWVSAENECGEGGPSEPATGSAADAPGIVTGLDATLDTVCGAVDLAWNPTSGAVDYVIHRNTLNDFNSANIIGTSTTPAARDGSGDPALSYFYWVTANGDCGEGQPGGPVTGSAAPKGDFNLDGNIDGADIEGFVEAYLGDASLFECADLVSPFGALDESDVSEMINLLIGA